MKLVRLTVALVIIGIVAVVGAQTAGASFGSGAWTSMTVSSDTLVPPTNLVVKCNGNQSRASVSWTPTIDAYATGYVVYVASGGTEASTSVSGGTTATATPANGVPANASVTVISTYQRWTSVRTTAVIAGIACH